MDPELSAVEELAEPVDGPWIVHTDVFEGPLDLLLYLVKREGIDLKNLPVRRVAQAYLDTLERFRELNLSVAGDYLVMAATLIHLKSLELLPRMPTPTAEDEEDPRIELVRRLEAYAQYKAAADELSERPWLGRDVFSRAVGDAPDVGPAAGIDAFGLLDLYYDLLAQSEEPEPVYEIHGGSGLDFESVCERLLDILRGAGGTADLGAIIAAVASRAERVLTFIATLEMTRLGWLGLAQDGHLEPVTLTLRVPSAQVDFGAISGWVETA